MRIKINKPGATFCLIACLMAVMVIGLGAFTRLVDAGLGCPDWPGCYGKLLWPDTPAEIAEANAKFSDAAKVDTDKTWPEMVHRYFASTLGLVIIGLVWLSFKQKIKPRKLSIALLVLVIVQGLFGMWTVTLKLWPQVVTAHLLGGFCTLALLWLLFLRVSTEPIEKSSLISISSRLRRMAMVGLCVVVVQIALGGWTTSNYAALACIDLPQCHQSWFPEMDFAQGFNLSQQVGPNYLGGLMDNEARTAIHFSHRVGALVVTLTLLILSALLWRERFKKLAGLVLAVLILQVMLGISNIAFALPLAVAVAHNLVGAGLLLVMVTTNFYLYRVYQVRPEVIEEPVHYSNNKTQTA